MRWVLFQLHWLLGITAGLVLAVMGVTGATLSFEDEILMALNPGVATVTPGAGPLLTGPQLAARVLAQQPDAKITRIIVQTDPALAAWVSYTPAGEKRETSFVDPVSGQLLGPGRGHGLFETVTLIHRYLALPGQGNGWGRQITGFSAIALIYFCLSGLYLRWPKRALDWRSWFLLDLRMTGRNLYRALHTIIGSWVLIFYLISGFTGLWWSYGWYRDGVTYVLVGQAEKADHKPAGAGKADDIRPDIALAWQGFERETKKVHYASITASLRDTGDVQFRAKLDCARHDRVSDELVISGVTGATMSAVPYKDRALGQDIVTSIFEIHRGAYFGLPGRIAMLLSSLTMPLFTITGLLLYLGRRRRKRALAALLRDAPAQQPALATDGSVIVAYASQTGSAERLARLTAASLPGARLLPLHKLDVPTLAETQQLFIIASTYGEGEPPDAARGFTRRMMAATNDLSHLRYAVMALGDREYPDFCAFGHSLDHWLHGCGAERLFELIEVDGDDANAQRQWQQQLTGLGARTDQPDWAPAPMGEWRLVERCLLNPGSAGGPAFHIALEPLAPGDAAWTAGDIFEVQPRHDPRRITAFIKASGLADGAQLREALAGRILPPHADTALDPTGLPPLAHREYSIASVPSSGRVELIVRQCVAEDGLLGLGSGWLTHVAPVGTILSGRIRTNAAFHPPEDSSKPLILIGNGTGLAGLLAHLHHRAAEGGAPSWLFFGERDPDHDALHVGKLCKLRTSGVLDQIDFAWSRASEGGCYVQHRVAQRKDEIEALVSAGASIYICGSVQGMAPAVHDVLEGILGAETLEALLESGRYRRDIY